METKNHNLQKKMKNKLTEWLVKPLINEVELPIEIGDVVLMGRFKNKKVKVKSITYNEKGDLQINGRPALKFRIQKSDKKLLPTKTTNKKSAEPDSDRKGVDDEYPHHKTENIKYIKKYRYDISKFSDAKKVKLVDLLIKKYKLVKLRDFIGGSLSHNDIEISQRALSSKAKKDIEKRFNLKTEAKRIPRKKGQHRGSSSHSDLYTDENPKGTIKGLKFATTDDAKKSVSKIRNSGKTHAHKIQAAVAMEQRAKEMGKTAQAGVYRSYINSMKKKTKKKNESFFGLGPGDIPSPSRKMVKKMKKKGNTSVPYGSGYKKIDERAKGAVSGRKVHKNITGFNLPYKGKKYKEIDMEVKKVDNKTEKVLLRILTPKKLFGQQVEVTFKELRRGPFMKTDTSKKVNEQKSKVKKVIAIYPGRFQPFGPHHKKVFDALQSKFGEAYITTSDIKQPPRHPMNYNEKVRHMVKMGVPKNRIIKEKVPYVANNLLRKFNKDTTAVVYVFGAKDAGRLKGGKKKSGGLTYYQDLKSNQNNLKGFEEHGYIYTAPTVKVSGISSGTEIRNLLGSPKFDDKKREQIFKKTFGYFDKGVYTMMTNKFKKLFEFYQQPQVKKILKEVSGFGTSVNASDMSDEGMYDFFGSLDDYFRVSKEHADVIGYELIGFPIKDSADMAFTIMADDYEQDRAKTVTYGKTINQNRKNTESVKNPYPKYKERLNKILSNLNWQVVKFFGEEHVEPKLSDSPLIKKPDVEKGIKHTKSIQESFQQDVDLLIEAMCGVGQNPADTGCTPKGKAKTKVKMKPFEIPKFKVPKFNIPKFEIDPEKMKKVAAKRKKRKEKALVRPDRKPNMKDGVDIIRDKKDTQHFIDDFLFKADKGVDLDKLTKEMGNQYQEQKKKLSKKEQKQLETDIESWKKYGGFEAIQNAIEDGDTTEQEIRNRNERISDLAHKTTNNIDKAIERGIEVPNDVANAILNEFKIGEMVEIPDESGHGSSGFSLSGETAREFSRVDGDGDKTSILFRIEPNSKGQLRGLYIDGDESSTISREREITRSSKSKAKVISVETKKLPNGKEVKIITLQEPDDLTETIIKEVSKKYSEISRRYLEGPLNPRLKKKELQKEHLILEGGAYGHMNHPFDDNNLTFSDLKNIIIIGLSGNLNREDKVSEKLDGQNLMISWVGGQLKAARNKGHLKNGGKTAPTTAGIANMFSGRGNIKKAFVGAMRDLEKSIGGLSNAQKKKIFGNGTKWMNLEVIYPQTANIIDYDVAEIVFHGTTEYDRTGRAKGYSKESARMLQGMIKQVNQNIQKTFKISKPNFLKTSKVQNYGAKKNSFLGKLNKLQGQYGLKDTDKLGVYHQSFWQEYIFNAVKQFNTSITQSQLVNLTNRWAFFDKSYSIGQIKKDFKDSPKFVDWILKTDKLDHNKMFKQNIKPFEVLFFQVGAEILKNMSGFLAVSPDAAVKKIKQDVDKALRDLQKPDNVSKLEKLKIQIEKLEAIGGSSAIVPSEGLVFKYKGNIYKFTGAFAPINQILGSLRF